MQGGCVRARARVCVHTYAWLHERVYLLIGVLIGSRPSQARVHSEPGKLVSAELILL